MNIVYFYDTLYKKQKEKINMIRVINKMCDKKDIYIEKEKNKTSFDIFLRKAKIPIKFSYIYSKHRFGFNINLDYEYLSNIAPILNKYFNTNLSTNCISGHYEFDILKLSTKQSFEFAEELIDKVINLEIE